MRRWQLKAYVQKLISMLPAREHVHYRMQRTIGGMRNVDKECRGKIDDWKIMMRHLQSIGVDIERSELFEIGTGWYPTFPICLYLVGARKVITFDLNRFLKPDLTLRCAQTIAEQLDSISTFSKRSLEEITEAHSALVQGLSTGASLSEVTGGRVKYVAPADACSTGLSPDSIDVVFSNSVLEHVPEPTIVGMMREARRILKTGGIVFHSVNCGDHSAYVDSSVNQLNYLRYSEAEWRKWNNHFLYQNRLR